MNKSSILKGERERERAVADMQLNIGKPYM